MEVEKKYNLQYWGGLLDVAFHHLVQQCTIFIVDISNQSK